MVRSCGVRVSFSSLWPAFTLTVHINALYNESVQRQEQHSMELIRFRKKISTLLPLGSFKWDNNL